MAGEKRPAHSVFVPSLVIRIAVVIQLAFLAWEFLPALSINGDNAVYYILGSSLASGQGYRQIHLADKPLETSYPVVFPLLLAVSRVVTENPLLAKVLIAGLGIGITLISIYLFSPMLTAPMRIALLVLLVTSALMAEYQIILMSETPYIFLTLLAVLLLHRSAENPRDKRLFWAALAVSILPVHCRGIGIVFSGAWIIACLWEKQYRMAIAHMIAAGVTVGLFSLLTPSEGMYYSNFLLKNVYDPEMGTITQAELFKRIMNNTLFHGMSLLARSIMPHTGKRPVLLFVWFTLYRIFIVFALVGWVRSLFDRFRIASLYVMFYMGIVLVWHIPNDRRILCLLPFLYFFSLRGMEFVLAAIGSRKPRSFFYLFKPSVEETRHLTPVKLWCVWAVVGGIALYNIGHRFADEGEKRLTPDWTNFYSCADWARSNTSEDAVVMSRKPELFYLRSRRVGCVYPFSHDVEKILAFMEEKKVRYVVFDNFGWTRTTAKYLYPVIRTHPEKFNVVYALKKPDTFILEFDGE